MIGLDTTVLIAHELAESGNHELVREHVSRLAGSVGRFALAPQVIHEFLYVATDPRRFAEPLGMDQALGRASFWWSAAEVVRTSSSKRATELTLEWMRTHKLGRKRILDTALAATYYDHGVQRIATANPGDFDLFNVFSFESWAMLA